jgi:cytochrome oxidase assembly protein ShyY1
LVGHALVVLFAGGFIVLGFWQYGRHHEKQDTMDERRAAYAAPAPELGDEPPASGERVEARGTYDIAHQVLLRDQVRGDEIGVDVLTPLVLANGDAVLVDRGWLPANRPVTDPPPGPIVVRGIARESSTRASPHEMRELNGRASVARIDIDEIEELTTDDLRPVWIAAQYQDPPPAPDAPVLPEPTPPTRVNHMQYALQWWALALIPIIGWPIVLVGITRRRRAPTEPDAEMVASGTHR